MDYSQSIAASLESGNPMELMNLVEKAIQEGIAAEEILNEGLIRGMAVIGQKFKDGEVFIPEVLIAAHAMTHAITRLEPLLAQSGVKAKGKLLIGTIKNDLHDIGKNLVAIMFKGAGFEVIDLGVDVSAERFVEAARQHQPDVIGLSALLTTTMVNMGSIIGQLRNNGCSALIIVGGAPVTAEFAVEVKADLYAQNAVEGVDKVLSAIR
ncbi:MAG: corrinoid protein [Candidatus Marinimicrobia bacterium]|jgi:5-methyltetrahydrofolate--homocysteine methyltransferase|nr:corrinoid protein [Candidatus Neomarinimicrobiota bacterium]MCK9559056.1 corrinoid protein [Candidatus Neomarinimicrobiota bacterium]MDD5060706.1 corrinoid protein [Candidatus Neomarinimicrobiota bacterium]